MARAKVVDASLEFAFFHYLFQFYRSKKSEIRKHYRDLSKKFLDFNDPEHNPKAFLRQPQFEALEIYIFLKEFLGNAPVQDIFKDWHEKKNRFAERGEGGIVGFTAQGNLFDKITEDQYKAVFASMRKNARMYPNYIFALTMGTGKTILMATCIFYEFILANKWPKDKHYCHNALVFAPDKTVLYSLKEIQSFDMRKVVPPEYVNFLTSHIQFHYLEDAGTSLSVLDRSRFNVIVSNTQKIILKKQHKEKSAADKLFGSGKPTYKAGSVYDQAADLYDFDQPEDEGELTTNQRFEKLTRLEQLGIYVDEAHHAFGKVLAKDMGIGAQSNTSLRTTIDMLAASLEKAGTHVVACYNYTGTPYVGKDVLPEVVYAYGLQEAINKGYLKKVKLHGYSSTKTDDFVQIAVDDFLKATEGLKPEGMTPKFAFFGATIEEITSELRPAVERALSKHGIPASRILVNVGDDKLTTNDDIREFNRLDSVSSDKQFILLVNKGREGWNCRSLFGVALFREPKSKVFVLQATMRCLRSVGDVQYTGQVYLTNDNLGILNDELQQNFRITTSELESKGTGKEPVQVRVLKQEKITLKRIKKSYSLTEKELQEGIALLPERDDKQKWHELTEKYLLIHTIQEGLSPGKASTAPSKTEDLTERRQKVTFSELSLVAEISRYLNRSPLEIDDLLNRTKEKTEGLITLVNDFNELLYDVIIPRLFNELYNLDPIDEVIEHEVELIKAPPMEKGYYESSGKPDLIVRESDAAVQKYKEKSFHLDTYCFDSSPEKTLFWDLLMEGKVTKVYFTGMLTHGQSDFYIQYIDPESHTVRSYYPDFLLQKEDGSYVIVEVKGDNMIDDPIVQAKKEFARQIATASGMEYQIIKGSAASERQYRILL
ncbi:TnsA endonuclease N-terminal domain-containing protein [Syntrophotalea acetylenica]|uniref:Type III restriction endonuclease n=1 Tax=Syntrophotalea acetylenica TaxID=29542 RepID=A0A1L3GJ31_SYNAC|nr:TnsA endonuclease N-terminal domain-containing protein [Syntrophotalea acetylenica]APG25947.1 type III restriction endonuclease [Syntrophotalea acetylenica]APG44016.1 type III restriction endonuclease [Syntrophotalea acetylenica]